LVGEVLGEDSLAFVFAEGTKDEEGQVDESRKRMWAHFNGFDVLTEPELVKDD
jgi:hypothetical protein